MPVELIPVGTDPHLFRPDVDPSALRAQLEIPEGSFVILSPRQITPHYNQETIVNAIPKVLKELPNAVFILKDTYTDRIGPEGDPASGHLIVDPTDVWVLDDYGDNRITLMACHPKYSARQRIVAQFSMQPETREVQVTDTHQIRAPRDA